VLSIYVERYGLPDYMKQKLSVLRKRYLPPRNAKRKLYLQLLCYFRSLK